MKKSIFVVAVLAAFTFASCKKDHVCVCKVNGTEYKRLTIKDTKKKAKETCETNNQVVLGNSVTCELE